MVLKKLDGAFPVNWWQISDTTDNIYDGAFPVLLGPSSKIENFSVLGQEVSIGLCDNGFLGHQFTLTPRSVLLRALSRITRKRLR